jgi:hypothetical protein
MRDFGDNGLSHRLWRVLRRTLDFVPHPRHAQRQTGRHAQLADDNHCLIFGQPDRPGVCVNLRSSLEMCGTGDEHAFAYLAWLEQVTRPCS